MGENPAAAPKTPWCLHFFHQHPGGVCTAAGYFNGHATGTDKLEVPTICPIFQA